MSNVSTMDMNATDERNSFTLLATWQSIQQSYWIKEKDALFNVFVRDFIACPDEEKAMFLTESGASYALLGEVLVKLSVTLDSVETFDDDALVESSFRVRPLCVCLGYLLWSLPAERLHIFSKLLKYYIKLYDALGRREKRFDPEVFFDTLLPAVGRGILCPCSACLRRSHVGKILASAVAASEIIV